MTRDQSRHFFNTRPPKDGRPAYLVWRLPFQHPDIRRQLAPELREWQRLTERDDTPKQITVGDYVPQADDRIGFVPRPRNPLAMAALDIESVQRRIAEDLVLQNDAGPGNYNRG